MTGTVHLVFTICAIAGVDIPSGECVRYVTPPISQEACNGAAPQFFISDVMHLLPGEWKLEGGWKCLPYFPPPEETYQDTG